MNADGKKELKKTNSKLKQATFVTKAAVYNMNELN